MEFPPSYGHSKRGRKCTTYPDSIVKDLDLEPNQIQQLMTNKITWRKFVLAASTIPSDDNDDETNGIKWEQSIS